MIIKDFSNWEEYKGNSMGSGRSEKIWLTNGDQIGLFKYPKIGNDNCNTFEHISEKLASDIATLLEVPCAKIEIGKYNDRDGCMSHIINKSDENLIEFISFITQLYPNYDTYKLYDSDKKEYYSLNMLISTMDSFELGCKKEFFEMIIFDALIGNSDRHHSNWAIKISKNNELSFAPLYDNGSSLCCYVNEYEIKNFLGNDVRRFKALTDSKSKSRIRINEKEKREPTYREVLNYIFSRNEYRKYCEDIIKKINNRITNNNINNLLSVYPDSMVSQNRKRLIFEFIKQKVSIIIESYLKEVV